MKKKILCVCAKGINRSKYLAGYLRRKGYKTRYGGVEYHRYWNPISQEDIDWADIIVIIRKRLEKIVKKKFKTRGKKFIVLDVTDSKRLLPKEFAKLKKLDYGEFQKKWTYPQLRRAIKSYSELR